MVNLKKNQNAKIYILLSLTLLCFIGVILLTSLVINNGSYVLSPSIDNWESRYIVHSDQGWYIDEPTFQSGDFSGDADEDGRIELIYGPFFSLEEGKYCVRVNYECSDPQSIRIYSFENEDSIHVDKPTILLPEDGEMLFDFSVSEDIDGFEIRVCYDSHGLLLIRNIGIYSEGWMYAYYLRNILFFISLILFSFSLIGLFRPLFLLHADRSAWLDLARGIGILLVLLGHTEPNPLIPFIYGFHMPFFFIISGMLYKRRPLPELIKKLITGYLLPYVLYCFANSILRIPYMLIGHYTFSGIIHKLELYWLGSLKGIWREMPNCMPLWFLPALAAALFVFSLIQYIPIPYVRYILYICLAGAGYLWDPICSRLNIESELPFGLHAVPAAVSFIAIGYHVVKRLMDVAWDHPGRRPVIIAVSAVTGIVTVIVNCLYFSRVDIYFNKYGNVFLMYLGSVSMSIAILMVCKTLDHRIGMGNSVAVIGRHSLFFFAFDYWARTVVSSFPEIFPTVQFEWIAAFVVKTVLISSLFVAWRIIKSSVLMVRHKATQ